MKRFKQLMMVMVVTGVLFIISACSSDSGTSGNGSSSEGGKDKLVVAIPFVLGSPSGAPMWLGEGLGYFEDESLDVEIISLPGKPSEVIGLVVAGKADIAISQPDALVYPLADGNDQGLSWVFTPYQRPIFGINVEEGSDISSPGQLEGKKVGMLSLGAPFETFMDANVKADGGDPSTIETVAINSNSAAMEALKKGDIDAFVGNQAEMAIAALVTEANTKLLPFPSEVEDGFAAGFVMKKDTDEQKRDVISRYIRSVVKSAVFAQENPDKAMAVNWEMYPASKATDKPEEQVLEEAKVSLGVTVNNYAPASDGQWGYISEERWAKFVANNGFSEKIPDVTVLYDYSLLEKINDFNEAEVREQAKNAE